MRITGLDGLERRVGAALAKRAYDLHLTLSEIGDNHVRMAVDRAPIKEGILRECIERAVEGDEVVIRVPLNSPAGEYATAMHEDDYEPGELSEAAGEAAGVFAGRKYMTRGREAAHPGDEEIIRQRMRR